MTVKEMFDIFKKYDKGAYEYYSNNAWFVGFNAKNYAEYLKMKNYH